MAADNFAADDPNRIFWTYILVSYFMINLISWLFLRATFNHFTWLCWFVCAILICYVNNWPVCCFLELVQDELQTQKDKALDIAWGETY
jgi:accessory gene regulator protein AgrB